MREEANIILEKYLTLENLNTMKYLDNHRNDYLKRDGRDGVFFHRGAYSHEVLKNLHVTNMHRGKVLKGLSRKSPDYYYYFDKNERMYLCVKNPQESAELTWIQTTEFGDFSVSIPLDEGDDFITIAETRFNQNRIVKYTQFEFELSDKINTLEKVIEYLNSEGTLLHSDISLYAFYFEELYYQDNKLCKGIRKYNETAYCSDSRIEEYEFKFHYRDGKLLKEKDIVELNNPFINQPGILEWLESLPCGDFYSKDDIELIEKVNAGLL